LTENSYIPLFELSRGTIDESIHYGAAAIVDIDGHLIASLGNPQTITYLRSTAKPLQALPFIERGGAKIFGLTSSEIAIICASHSGTDEHVSTIRSIHNKVGVMEDDLLCGIHWPSHPPTVKAMQARGEKPTPNRHNCSGKHSGMLAFARLSDWSINNYIDPNHPVQQAIIHTFSDMCELPIEQIHLGIDGCSAPNFAVPLFNAALAYSRLCDPERLPTERANACRTITSAMMSHPEMVGGPDSFDTQLMKIMEGKLVCKGGAEGYQGIGILAGAMGPGTPALGIVVKISDGDLGGRSRFPNDTGAHARPAVVLEILRQLGAISNAELTNLTDYSTTFQLQNWRGLIVGDGKPCFELKFT
jgi:L-asparaginase II